MRTELGMASYGLFSGIDLGDSGRFSGTRMSSAGISTGAAGNCTAFAGEPASTSGAGGAISR
jgi:hypothetical protein